MQMLLLVALLLMQDTTDAASPTAQSCALATE
eukprot:COSAG02_NODE_31072_length_539_cov_4.227273_1_plen_31_part_10